MASPIYDFFVQNNLTQKSEEEFLTQYSDKNSAETVYNFMKNNDLTQKDFDSFYNQYFNQSLGEANGGSQNGFESTSVTSQLQGSNLSEPSSSEGSTKIYRDLYSKRETLTRKINNIVGGSYDGELSGERDGSLLSIAENDGTAWSLGERVQGFYEDAIRAGEYSGDIKSFYNEYFSDIGKDIPFERTDLYEAPVETPSFDAISPAQPEYMTYNRWLEASGITDVGQDGNGVDYDYRGFFEEFGARDIKGHYTDKYKLPNHPTFSTGSKYSTEEQQGGKWTQDGETGKWTFEASDFNLQNLSPDQLTEYFRQNDPQASLILPDGTLAYEGELPVIAEVDVDVYATNPNQDRLQQNIQYALQRELDLQSAQSIDPSNLTFGENLYNNLNNLAFGFYGTTDRAELFAANVANQLSKVADGKLTSWMFSPDELNSYIQKQLVTLDNYDSQLLPTNSDVLDDIAEGRYSEIPQGAVSAISGLVATIVPAYVSGGTLLATDMISNSTRDFNKTKAQRLGISENELYRSGQSDFVVPAMLGAVSFGLEKIGLRGLERAMSQQFTSNILQSGARFLYNIGKEGAQEQLQYAVDRINTSLAEGKAPTTAVEEGLRDAYTTREGWNQAVMGAIASGTIGTLGALTNRIANQSLKAQAQQQVQEASNIQRELDRTDLNETSRTVLQQQMEQIRNNLGQTILQDIESVANLSNSQNRQVETLLSELETVQSTINDPSVADDAKQGLQQRSQELSNQIDAIINQESVQENQMFRENEQVELMNTEDLVVSDTIPVAEVEVTQEEQVNVPITEDDRVSIINSLRDEEGRTARADAALNRIRDYIRDRTRGNLGITPEGGRQRAAKDIQFFKDVVEYASIKLLDGTIKTYEQFRTLVNLPNSKELREAFSFARAKVVNPQKYAIWETVDTFNKGFTQGVRQGVEQERERASTREKTREQIRKDREQRQTDNLKASKQQLVDRLNRARREGTFRGFVRGSTIQSVIRDINNATTPRQVQRALTRLNSAIEDINYDRKVADITKKFRQLRRRSQSDNTPAGQVPIADQVSRIKPRDISPEYIDEVNQLLDQYIATRSNDLGQQLLDLVNSGRAGQSLASLKSQLLIAGATQEEVDGVNSVTKGLEILDKYLPSIAEEQGEEGGKSPSRVRREAKVQALRNALATVDTEGLTPIRIRALNAFQEIDYESINDQQLRTLEEAMVDAFSNSTFYLAGDIITLNEEQQRFSDTAMLERIKNGTRTVSSTITNILKNLGNVRAQFEAIVNRSIDWPELAHISGFIDINQSTEVFHRRYQEIVGKPLEQLAKKYRDDLNDPVQSALGAMYSDLAQYRSTWTQEEIQAEFDGRKKAIRESIDRMQDRTVNDSRFRSESKSLIENLNKAYDLVQSANTAEELYNLLNTGQRQLHNLKTTSFQTIFPDFVDNAMIFNNTLIDRDWVNYIPRSYRAMETIAERRTQAQAEMLEATENAAAFQGGVTTSETSGAANSRVLQGEELPTGKAIWFDSIDNFTAEFKKALYDIETQGARKYTSRVMRTGRVSEVIADRSAGDALLRGIATKVTNDKNLLFPRRELDVWRKISYNIEQLATRQALGALLQPLKQGAPAIIATMGRLGRNSYLVANAVKEYTANPNQVLKLMQDSPISRRAIRKTIAPSQALSQRDINQIKSQLRNAGGRAAERAINIIDTVSLKPMEIGDRLSARVSFLAFYMDYFKRNGLKFNLAEEANKPNRFALEYANQQSDVALNISDPSLRPKWRLPVYISPFSSFSLNEKANALLNTGKLLSPDSSGDTRLNAAKNLGSHVATLVGYQGISWGIRLGMIGGAISTATYLLSKADLDDDDKKEAEEMLTELKNGMIDRNNSNSVEYALKDLVYGGIGGDLTEPLYTQLRNTVGSAMGWEAYTPYQGTETDRAFGALGGLGVPFQRAYTAYQNVDQFTKTDAEYRMERFGIENAQGTDFYVPVDYVNETIPDFSKQIYGAASIANIVGMTGASWQEVTALTSRLTRLAAQLEAKVASQTSDKSGSRSTGKPRKTEQEDLQRLESLKRISIEGEPVQLEEQEYDYLLRTRADFLGQNYDVIKPALGSVFGDERSERRLSTIADEYAREMTIMNFNLITGQKALDRLEKQNRSAEIWTKHYNRAHNIQD